jgi:predicted enzyme related to lactoylglutathione lyase
MSSAMQLVVFPTKDLTAAKKLFSTLLGVDPYVDQPYYVGFRSNGLELGLDPNGHARGGAGPICFWEVDDINATVESLVAAGGEIGQAAHDVGGGKLVATVRDADGNVVGLQQAP